MQAVSSVGSLTSTVTSSTNSRNINGRSESMAYPVSTSSIMVSKVQYLCRQHSKTILTATVCLLVLLFFLEEQLPGSSNSGHSFLRQKSSNNPASKTNFMWGGAIRPGYFYPAHAVRSEELYSFAAVTDLDELSRHYEKEGSTKPEFRSYLLGGSIQRKTKSESNGSNTYEIVLNTDEARTLITKHNEANRGAEFSELTVYQNRLMTFDDRTGDVMEILNTEDGKNSFVVPRFVVTEGNGETDKGMKWEWSTVKDGEMYMGSMGKEYTLSDGTVKNRNNLWIAIINEYGQIRRQDWTSQYGFVRHALECDFPGYIIIEACRWSEMLKKWVFLPRRISKDAYDEVKDEQMGGHQLVLVDEGFTTSQVIDLKLESLDPLKGFSTFAFVPNSGDKHVLAIRSVEENCVDFTLKCQQRTYFVVIDILTGESLSNEVQYKDFVKFEGVEFVDLFAKPPPLVV